MYSKKMLSVLPLLIITGMLLAACQPAAAAPTAKPVSVVATVAPTEAPVVPTVAPTEAPMWEKAFVLDESLVSGRVAKKVGSAPKHGGILTMAIIDITHFDPVSIAADVEPYSLVFEPLFELDSEWNPTPLLAESQEMSADGLVHTIKLRKGIKFHDGSDFNAAVVKWNFDRKIAQKSPYVKEIPFANNPVAVVDDYTITITLAKPSFVMYKYLCGSSWMMYSKQFVESVTADDLKNRGIGTGPYVLKEYLPGDRIVVDANPNYWQAGMPFFEQVIMRVVPDAQARLLMLQAGEVQWIKDLSIQDFSRLEGNKDIVAAADPGTRTYFIAPHHMRRPFDDVRVRQALNYGVDKQAMQEVIFEDKLPVSTGLVTASVKGSMPNEPYAYNPEKAMALLDEAGVVDTNGDGFREVDGKEKAFIFFGRKGRSAGDAEIQETFAAYMAAIGLNVKIEIQDGAQFFTILNQPYGQAPYYDLSNQSPSNFIADLSYPLETQYSCKSWPGTAFNYAHYCNKTADALINEGNSAVTLEERNAKYNAAQKIMWEEAVVVWLFDGNLTSATAPSLKGVFSDGAHNTWQVKYAWFSQ